MADVDSFDPFTVPTIRFGVSHLSSFFTPSLPLKVQSLLGATYQLKLLQPIGLLRVFLMRALSKKHARFCTRSQILIRNTLVNTKIFTNINIFQNILTNFQMLRETNKLWVDKGR